MMTRTLVTAFALVGLMGAQVQAEPSAEIQRPLMDRTLKSLPFDKTVSQSMAWVRSRLIRHAYKTLDPAAARARAAQESARLAKETIRFDGLKPSGYEDSVIADEFKTGNDETLIAFSDGLTQHYLFFFKGKLYKYARPVAAGEVSFVDRVQLLASSLGEPTGTFSPDGTPEGVAAANWLSKDVQTRVMDRRATHQTDLLVLEDAHLARAVAASRAGIANAAQRAGVSSELDAFLEDAPVE